MPEIPAIEAEGLVKQFGATRALAGLTLAAPQGSIFGLLGPNGAGKTTAVRVLATLTRPDAGRARVMGADVVRQAAQVRPRIGLTGQFAALDDYLTGRANLVMIGRLSHLARARARHRAEELLDRFDLADAAGRVVKTYSGGMRRRLDLAASLISAPDVLFLDEPTTGLDPRSRAVTWQVVRELAAGGTTVLLTTQYLEEADQLADRIAVIDAGAVIAEGAPAELKAQIGQDRLEITVAAGADLAAAAAVVKEQAEGQVESDAERSCLTVAVRTRDGLISELVRELDLAGVQITSVVLRQPSLDDVFLTLTGRRAVAGPAPFPSSAEAA